MNGLRWWQWRQKRRTRVDYEAGLISASTFADRMGYPAPGRDYDTYMDAVKSAYPPPTDPFEFVPLQYTPPPPPDLPPYEGNPTMLHARPKPEPEPVWDVIVWREDGSNITEVSDFVRANLTGQPGESIELGMSNSGRHVASPGCTIARSRLRDGTMRYWVYDDMDALRREFDVLDDEVAAPARWRARSSIKITGVGLDGATMIDTFGAEPEVEVQSMDQFVNGEPGERMTHEEYMARGGVVGKDRIRVDNPDFPQVERAFSNRERNTISWEGENYYTVERAMEVIDNVDAMETARDESEQPTKEDPRPWAILAEEEPRQPWAILADLHERVAALVIRRPWEAETPRTAHCAVEYNAGLINALDLIAEAVHGYGGSVDRVPVPPEEEPVDEASDEPEGQTIDTPFGKVYVTPVRLSLPDPEAISAALADALGPFFATMRGEKPASDEDDER